VYQESVRNLSAAQIWFSSTYKREGLDRQMGRLTRKVTIITGAGGGIGRAIAKLFAAEHSRVAIVDCADRSARAVEREIRAEHLDASCWIADLSDAGQAETTIRQIARHFGRIDILVNNAATYVSHSFEEMTAEEWNRVLNVNLTAYFLCARTSAREMQKLGGGSIVNISSVQRAISEPKYGAYATSKAGIAQLTRSLAIELAPANIVVNSISPGFIRTGMSLVNGIDETTTPHFLTYYVESGRIPLGRAGLPEEVAAATLFLASRECGYLTGADITVDGGLTITI
jgi:NAD(P)-dependent dehydrogenase (short-subunit alcohol dehydrogenase family)